MSQTLPPNPPTLPPSPGPRPPSNVLDYSPPPKTDILQIARYQRFVIYCLIARILLTIGVFVPVRELALISNVAALVVTVATIAFLYILARYFYSIFVSLLFIVISLLPLFGLIALLMVNQRAVNALRRNHVRVGLLGANKQDLQQLAS